MRFFLALLAVVSTTCQAAQFIDRGAYRIHYATFSSMIIPAEVAQAHQIVRAENRIVVNISARKDQQPVALALSGHVTNLLEQRVELRFSEVREAEAIYYLATHPAMAEDTLQFELLATPPAGEPVSIRFLRRYD